MKSFVYSLFFLTLIGLFSVKLSAQDQAQQQDTQTTTTVPEGQSTTVSETNPVQTQTQVSPKLKPFADELSIAEQFAFAIDKSSNFQDYKVIRQTWVTKLKANTLDTLQTLKSNLNSSKVIVLEKTKMIDSLRSELNSTQSELLKKNSFSFFGIMVSKTGYDSIMWSIIIGLIVAVGFMFAAFRRSFAVTNQTKKDLLEVKEEFEVFRKKALKSKEEAVRQLHDELNKYKNMK